MTLLIEVGKFGGIAGSFVLSDLMHDCRAGCNRLWGLRATSVTGKRRGGSHESLNAGLGAAQDQRMHIMRAFIGVHRFQIDHVADDVKFV